MNIRLAASTVPTVPGPYSYVAQEKVWREQVESFGGHPWHYAFFVFEIVDPFPVIEYSEGLACHECEDRSYLAGTASELAIACLHYCSNDYPSEAVSVYGYIHTKLNDWGFKTLGTKVPTIEGFILR